MLVVLEPAGKLAASGRLKEEGEAVLELDAYVHPENLGSGLGGFLLDWAEEESRRRDRSTLRTSALTADPAAKPLIEGGGFEPVRHFYRMLIDLDAQPPEAVWPEGFEVATFATGDEATLHAVTEDAFAHHWGHEPRDLEHWDEHVFSQAWWDPSLVDFVREGDEVAAAEINAFRFGMGWVGTLGTAFRGEAAGSGGPCCSPRSASSTAEVNTASVSGRCRQRDRRHAPLRERRHARVLAGRRVRERHVACGRVAPAREVPCLQDVHRRRAWA
jgi:hypothetical protein